MRFKHWFENIFSQPSADEIHSAQGFWHTAIDAVHMGHFRSVNQALAAVAVHQLEIQSPEEVGRELGICLAQQNPSQGLQPMQVFALLKSNQALVSAAQRAFACYNNERGLHTAYKDLERKLR